MSTTIFCTFEQQDLADLAVGKLRSEIAGIKSIHYIGGLNQLREYPVTQYNNSVFGAFDNSGMSAAPAPSHPVTVKIVCSDESSGPLKSRLVNLRAYQIITTR